MPDQRRVGHSRLVYDKATRTIKPEVETCRCSPEERAVLDALAKEHWQGTYSDHAVIFKFRYQDHATDLKLALGAWHASLSRLAERRGES